MALTVEELAARVRELEGELARLRSAALVPVAGTVSVGIKGGTSHTVMGAEEMVLQVGADDAISYVNPPMARLLGIPDRKGALGLPFAQFDHGPIGDGVLAALVQMGRRSEDLHLLERPCPGLPLGLLPPSKGARPATDPVLRFSVAGVQGRVQITAQDVTPLKWLESPFSRCGSPAVIEQMHETGLKGLFTMERRTLSVLFVDMRGFTKLSQSLEPEQVGELVGSFLASMVACVEKVDGTIDNYVGDKVMAFFGAPVERADHAMRALVCAVEMQRADAASASPRGPSSSATSARRRAWSTRRSGTRQTWRHGSAAQRRRARSSRSSPCTRPRRSRESSTRPACRSPTWGSAPEGGCRSRTSPSRSR
jgi:hypothetical protein